MVTKGFFQFEITIHVFVSSFRFIWIPRCMLHVYGQYISLLLQCGDRHNLTSLDVRFWRSSRWKVKICHMVHLWHEGWGGGGVAYTAKVRVRHACVTLSTCSTLVVTTEENYELSEAQGPLKLSEKSERRGKALANEMTCWTSAVPMFIQECRQQSWAK